MSLKRTAKRIFFSALEEVLPENIISSSVSFKDNTLIVNGFHVDLSSFNRVFLFGCGKASLRMARSLEGLIGDRIDGGFVVTNFKEFELDNVEVFESSHPVPDERSRRAAVRMKEALKGLLEDDLFLFLLSGGASSLMEDPIPPITVEEIAKVNELLIKSGADIYEINCVRKHLSTVKGGKLARLTRAKGIVLVISDVVRDNLEIIGSGPLYCDSSIYPDAYRVLERFDLLKSIPDSVRAVIEKGLKGEIPETPKEPPPNVSHFIVGNNLKALTRARDEAERLGFNAMILTSMLEGEAREVAKAVVSIAAEVRSSSNPLPPPACLLLGGETTVTVRGNGKGGRNQELCLSALKSLKGLDRVAVLSAGTDGIDGNSDAAGAVVDVSTLKLSKDFDIDEFLNRNDSNSFFKVAGGLIKTGVTGTNVMDVVIVLIGRER